jgi:hypothetical protein
MEGHALILQGRMHIGCPVSGRFLQNGVVFNWCSYLLEEFLIACEEVQEKGETFTYGYLLLSFTMLKWRPPSGR